MPPCRRAARWRSRPSAAQPELRELNPITSWRRLTHVMGMPPVSPECLAASILGSHRTCGLRCKFIREVPGASRRSLARDLTSIDELTSPMPGVLGTGGEGRCQKSPAVRMPSAFSRSKSGRLTTAQLRLDAMRVLRIHLSGLMELNCE
jgi:hypothetical protein